MQNAKCKMTRGCGSSMRLEQSNANANANKDTGWRLCRHLFGWCCCRDALPERPRRRREARLWASLPGRIPRAASGVPGPGPAPRSRPRRRAWRRPPPTASRLLRPPHSSPISLLAHTHASLARTRLSHTVRSQPHWQLRYQLQIKQDDNLTLQCIKQTNIQTECKRRIEVDSLICYTLIKRNSHDYKIWLAP